jgi:hypothetical protein
VSRNLALEYLSGEEIDVTIKPRKHAATKVAHQIIAENEEKMVIMELKDCEFCGGANSKAIHVGSCGHGFCVECVLEGFHEPCMKCQDTDM